MVKSDDGVGHNLVVVVKSVVCVHACVCVKLNVITNPNRYVHLPFLCASKGCLGGTSLTS